jgi:hypothetical protein
MKYTWKHVLVLALVALGAVLAVRTCSTEAAALPARKQANSHTGTGIVVPESAALPLPEATTGSNAPTGLGRELVTLPPEVDPTTAMIARLKVQSKWGPMSDQLLASLLGMLSNLERQLREAQRQFLEQGGQLNSKTNAEYIENIQATLAKMDALLAGSYLLTKTKDEKLPTEVGRDPNLHVVQTTGGFAKDDPSVSLTAWILIDMRKFPTYVESQANLEAVGADEAKRASSR